MFSLASLWQQTSSVLYTLHCTQTTYYTHTLFQQVAPQLDSFGDFSLRYSCFNWVLDPSRPKVAAKLMPDSAHYFEASSCLLCSILAVQVLKDILMYFSLTKYERAKCAECPSPWVQPAGCLAGHWTRPAALRLHQHVHHQVVQNIISLEMRLFTRSYICSASATRNFVHSVSTLFEIILLVLLGNDLSTITRGNGETFPVATSARLNIRRQ